MKRARAVGSALAVAWGLFTPYASFAQSTPNLSLESATVWTIDQAIALALDGEPSVLAAKAQLLAADASVAEARAGGRGALLVQGQGAYGYNDYGSGYNWDHPLQISLGYERILWDNRATAAALAGARSGQAARSAQLDVARLKIRADVASAWIDLAVARSQIDVAQANLTAVTRHERDATLQFNAGEVPRSIMAQATARRALAQADLQTAKHDETLGIIELQRLTGAHFAQADMPTSYPAIPPTLAEAFPLLRFHPALAAARANRHAADSGVQLAAGKAGPQVFGGVRANHVRDEFLPGYRRDGGEGYVRFQVPLWDGGARTARISGARAAQTQADADIVRAERAIDHDLRQAYAGRDAAQAQVEASSLMASASQTALDSVQAEFRVGQRPIVDLLDAQREQTQSQTMLARARGTFILSHWWIAAALGQGGGS